MGRVVSLLWRRDLRRHRRKRPVANGLGAARTYVGRHVGLIQRGERHSLPAPPTDEGRFVGRGAAYRDRVPSSILPSLSLVLSVFPTMGTRHVSQSANARQNASRRSAGSNADDWVLPVRSLSQHRPTSFIDAPSSGDSSSSTVVLFAATRWELADLRRAMAIEPRIEIEGVNCFTGRHAGRTYWLVPTGIGPKAAASAARAVLNRHRAALAISAGFAGALMAAAGVGGGLGGARGVWAWGEAAESPERGPGRVSFGGGGCGAGQKPLPQRLEWRCGMARWSRCRRWC